MNGHLGVNEWNAAMSKATRATQMLELRHPGGKIRVILSIADESPRVQGNANQLFQAFVEIIENAMDALEEAGGGNS